MSVRESKRLRRFVTPFALIFSLLLQNFLFIAQPVLASSKSWTFSSSSDYTFDNSKISFSSNQAQLKSLSNWYDNNWKYRKKITINTSTSAVTNYQVNITLNASNFDFSKAKSAGEDLRFTDDDGQTPINWWRESYDSGATTASIWVKVPSMPASSTSATKDIYMYYGNNNASLPSTTTFTKYNAPALTNAASALTTPTYDGSGQAVHPDIIYVADGWNGYKYWMLFEPLPGGGSVYEDPSILASNDGSNWELPQGLTNPLVPRGYPTYYNSDGDMIMVNGTLYVYYRDTLYSDGSMTLKRTSSTDGVHWTDPVNTNVSQAGATFASPSFIYDNGTYYVFYVNTTAQKVYYQTSNDGLTWSGETQALAFNSVWHVDIKEYDSHFIMLLTDNHYLYYLRSEDKVNWTQQTLNPAAVLSPSASGWDNSVIYRSSFVVDGSTFKVWYSAHDASNVFHIGYAVDNNWSYTTTTNRDTSGSTVFDFFDDFESGTFDTSKWTQVQTGGGSTALFQTGKYEGNYSLKTNGAGGVRNVLSSTYQGASNAIYEAYIKSDNPSNFFSILSSSAADTSLLLRTNNAGNTQIYRVVAGALTSRGSSTTIADTTVWKHWKAIYYNQNISFYVDDQLLATATDSVITGGGIGIRSGDFPMYADQVRIRKYTSPEPSINTVGGETVAYNINNPSVTAKTATAQYFTTLSGFTETATKNSGEIKYQLSNDSGTTWYWYNSGWTSTNTGYTEANTASEINSNITSFPQGNGQLLIKAYLHSDGTQLVQLSSVDVTYANTPPTISNILPSPSSSGASITWTTSPIGSSKIDYGLTNNYGNSTDETDTSTRVTSHTVSLTGLNSCITYHYRVRSTGTTSNEQIGSDNTFTTTGCTAFSQATATQSAQIVKTAGGTLILQDGNSHGLTLTIPTGFAASDTNFQAHQLNKITVLATTSNPSDYSAAGNYIYELKALTDLNTTLSSFSQPLTVKISYVSTDTTGLDESTLKIWRYDGSSWNMLSGCTVDTSAKTVTCTTANFSVFGLFGLPSTSSSGSSSSSASSSTSTPICSDQTPGAKAPWLYGAITQDSGGILLYFTAADNPVSKYVLEYGIKSGEYPYGSQELGVNSRDQMTFLVKSLSPNTKYYFKVRASNGCQPGAWSNEISATTKPVFSTGNLDIVSSDLTTINNPPVTPSPALKKGTTVEKPKPTEFTGYDVKVKVLDTNNKPVEGAKVTMHSKIQETTTDKNGIAQFHNVEQGDHKVLIAYDGYKGEQSLNLTGDVKEFDLNVKVQKDYFKLSPLAFGIIAGMGLVIIVLIILLLKAKRKETR